MVPELRGTSLRRVCFQLDELVELRTYEQVEADGSSKEQREFGANPDYPTVRDMTVIDPYASSTPLDRADLYLQCCKVYRVEPKPEIDKQLRSRGPRDRSYEGPRSLELHDVNMDFYSAVALADCLGLPLTGKHLTEVILDNCQLSDVTLQLLLSCLYTSARLERLDIRQNPGITGAGVRCALCYLCLSPQLQRFSWQGSQFDSECARLVEEIMSKDSKVRALRELSLTDSRISHEDLAQLLPVARRSGVVGFGLSGINMEMQTMEMLAAMVRAPNAIRFLELSNNDLDAIVSPLILALDDTSPLISLAVQNCGLSRDTISRLLTKLSMLPNFRRLSLCGHDLHLIMPVLQECLPKFRILRRLGLSNSNLASEDIVSLCEVLAESKISELLLSGISLNASALSALYALSRVSDTLVNLEIDIPQDPHSEKLGRRILGECIQNMENHEASVEFTETDTFTSVVLQHRKLAENTKIVNRHDDLHDGAQGIVSALDQHLDNTDDGTAKELALDMLHRAKHIKENIEPALSEPLSELQLRRLTLVAETLEKVITRFEQTYPECRSSERTQDYTNGVSSEEVYEHTGRSRAHGIPRRGTNSGVKSKQLEAEEGEIMKLSHRMNERLNILKSASASASPSRGPSRGELADQQEASMLERLSQADGFDLKQRLYELQQNDHNYERTLGQAIS